jgi:hypothetical protein
MMRSAFVVAVVALAAAPGLARLDGHPGATGSPGGGTCNRCHSPQTYDGIAVEVDTQAGRVRDCYARDDQTGMLGLAQQIVTLPYADSAGTFNRLDVVVTEPGDGDPAADPPVPGIYCPLASGDNTPGTCGGGIAYAGFAIEILGALPSGGPVLRPAGGEGGMKQAGATEAPPGSLTEVNHSEPKNFEGGTARWALEFERPVRGSGVNSYQFYASANACNRNGAADIGDISAVTNTTVFFEYGPDEGEHTGPECNESLTCESIGATLNPEGVCACEDGSEFEENGKCPTAGCSHTAVRTSAPALGGLAFFLLLGAGILRRRR